jgi:hypothetical protein
MTRLLKGFFQADVSHYRAHYKDVHDRNVMFEIRPANGRGWPIAYQDCLGKVRRGKVGLRAIDVR